MSLKQINARVPQFMRDEFDQLRIELREIGSKPTVDDLVAALIHAATESVEQTKQLVEEYVRHELAMERTTDDETRLIN